MTKKVDSLNFNSLPEEVAVRILSLCSLEMRLNLLVVTKRWSVLTRGEPIDVVLRPGGLRSLKQFQMVTHFSRVVRLDVSGCAFITDQHAKRLRGLKTLLSLQMDRCQNLTDLSPVRPLARLRMLSLTHCSRLGNTAGGHLARLTSLQGLRLDFCPVTDTTVMRLSRLTNLQLLSLAGCRVSPLGLQRLTPLVQLRSLNLQRCRLFGSVEFLSRLTNLTYLDVRHTALLTPVALTSLQNLTILQDF